MNVALRVAVFVGAILACGISPRVSAQCAGDEVAKLLASDGAEDDEFGSSVSVSGDVVVVGATLHNDNGRDSGSAYVFRFSSSTSTWIEEAELLASDGAAFDRFGSAVSVSGEVAIVGAYSDDDNGSAYVYRFDGSTWNEEAKLLASDGAEGDFFGRSVSVSGDIVVVGADGDDDNGTRSGSAYVYRFDGSTWIEEAKLLASDGAADDRFGVSVSLNGNVAVIGSYWDDDNGTDSGSAYVYRFDGSTWIEEAKLLASDGAEGDVFGISVSLSGDLAVVGAIRDDDNGIDSGSAYVYRFNGSTWIEESKLLASDGVLIDRFGTSVSVSGDVVVVGADLDDDNGWASGSAYVYRFNGSTWIEEAKLLASDGATNDAFGGSVSASGDVAVAGANRHAGTDSGSAYVFNLLCNEAVILFDPPEEFPTAGVPNVHDVGDLDNDTDPDVVIALPDTDEIEVFLNQGGDWGGLQSPFKPFAVGDNPSGIALGSFDSTNDAFLDVAVSNAGDGTVSILINQGDGTFVAGTPINVGTQPSDVIAADFDLDTLVDLAVSDFIDNTVRIYHGNGLGGFLLADTINTGGVGTARVRSKDVDNDKDIDIAGVNSQFTNGPGPAGSVFVLLNLEAQTGGFDPTAANYPIGNDPMDLSAADLDGDFYADIAAVNAGDDTVSILLNNGDGTYTDWEAGALPVGMMPLSIDAVDLDGDLDPDLAIVAEDPGIGPAVQVLANLLNEGNGLGFGDPQGFSVDADPKFIASADFNTDQAFDLVTVNEDAPGEGSVTVLLGTRSFLAGAAGFSVPFGAYQDGTISDLYESDNAYVNILQRAGVSPLLPLIRLEVDGVSSSETASKIVLTIETAATALPPTVPQEIAMRNHVTSVWELLDERVAPLNDFSFEIPIVTNASRFIEPGTALMQMRLDWFYPGDVFSASWLSRTDQAIWTVTQ